MNNFWAKFLDTSITFINLPVILPTLFIKCVYKYLPHNNSETYINCKSDIWIEKNGIMIFLVYFQLNSKNHPSTAWFVSNYSYRGWSVHQYSMFININFNPKMFFSFVLSTKILTMFNGNIFKDVRLINSFNTPVYPMLNS